MMETFAYIGLVSGIAFSHEHSKKFQALKPKLLVSCRFSFMYSGDAHENTAWFSGTD